MRARDDWRVSLECRDASHQVWPGIRDSACTAPPRAAELLPQLPSGPHRNAGVPCPKEIEATRTRAVLAGSSELQKAKGQGLRKAEPDLCAWHPPAQPNRTIAKALGADGDLGKRYSSLQLTRTLRLPYESGSLYLCRYSRIHFASAEYRWRREARSHEHRRSHRFGREQ